MLEETGLRLIPSPIGLSLARAGAELGKNKLTISTPNVNCAPLSTLGPDFFEQAV